MDFYEILSRAVVFATVACCAYVIYRALRGDI